METRYDGHSRRTKYDCLSLRNVHENAARICVIYRFCFVEFMRKMIHTFSKDVLKGIKKHLQIDRKELKCQLVTKS